LGDLIVFVYTDYENITENVSSPTISFGKHIYDIGRNTKMCNNLHTYGLDSDKPAAIG
jgi:hypothetical protein